MLHVFLVHSTRNGWEGRIGEDVSRTALAADAAKAFPSETSMIAPMLREDTFGVSEVKKQPQNKHEHKHNTSRNQEQSDKAHSMNTDSNRAHNTTVTKPAAADSVLGRRTHQERSSPALVVGGKTRQVTPAHQRHVERARHGH